LKITFGIRRNDKNQKAIKQIKANPDN